MSFSFGNGGRVPRRVGVANTFDAAAEDGAGVR
jgi:hypothetical protein